MLLQLQQLKAAVFEAQVDNDMKVIFQCAIVLHKAILQSAAWEFNGSLSPDITDKMAAKLYTMLQWIMRGVASDLRKTCDQATDDVADKACILAQQIMYCKTRKFHP